MRIILGIFDTEYFEPKKYNAFSFYEFANKIHMNNKEDLRTYILKVMFKAKEIIFILDNIETPINTIESVACFELSSILSNKELFDKTQFYLKNEKIEKNIVFNTYNIKTN